ncbi:hypothetical protein C8Q74DRAFT_529522 [Fomes fomentarius]|nr:hypothetical protein C8Q74DRAFT_529522 [Fomes fomentarius]
MGFNGQRLRTGVGKGRDDERSVALALALLAAAARFAIAGGGTAGGVLGNVKSGLRGSRRSACSCEGGRRRTTDTHGVHGDRGPSASRLLSTWPKRSRAAVDPRNRQPSRFAPFRHQSLREHSLDLSTRATSPHASSYVRLWTQKDMA